MGIDVSLWAAFGAGLLSFLSPCVLPLVPPYLCFITGTSLDELTESGSGASRQTLLAALLFVLGFSTVFVLLGATASAAGQVLHVAKSWEVDIGALKLNVLGTLAGLVIIIMGLHFLGAFR